MSALPAQRQRRIAAPVQEQQYLVARVEVLAHGLVALEHAGEAPRVEHRRVAVADLLVRYGPADGADLARTLRIRLSRAENS